MTFGLPIRADPPAHHFQVGHAVTQAVINARANLHARLIPKFGTKTWVTVTAMNLRFRSGKRSFLTRLAHHMSGSTPLMLAVMFDLFVEASLMLQAGSPLDARNNRGADVRELAEVFGVSEVVRSLLREPRP